MVPCHVPVSRVLTGAWQGTVLTAEVKYDPRLGLMRGWCLVCRRIRTEKYMQAVFAIAAVTLFVPVIYHRQTNEDVAGLDANAPGELCWAVWRRRRDVRVCCHVFNR